MGENIKTIFEEKSREPLPPLTIDWDLYAELLADSDLTPEEQQEFVETLWSIVVSFVDLGFGVHPVQQASQESSGQSVDIAILIQRAVLSSQEQLPDNQTITIESKARPFSKMRGDS